MSLSDFVQLLLSNKIIALQLRLQFPQSLVLFVHSLFQNVILVFQVAVENVSLGVLEARVRGYKITNSFHVWSVQMTP